MLPKLTLLANALDRLNKLVTRDETPIESARRAADSLIKYCLNPDSDKAEKLALVAANVLAGKPVRARDRPDWELRPDGIPISQRPPVPPEDDGVSDPADLVERTYCDYGVPEDFDSEDLAFYRAKFIKRILSKRATSSQNGLTEPRAHPGGARGATPPHDHPTIAPSHTGPLNSTGAAAERSSVTNGDVHVDSERPGQRASAAATESAGPQSPADAVAETVTATNRTPHPMTATRSGPAP